MRYLNNQNVKKLINREGKRAGKDFLFSLDVFIEQKLIKACAVHNGSKQTLDSSVFTYVFGGLK